MKDELVLRIALSDGRHVDVPLGWLRAQLEPQGFHVVEAYEGLALAALAAAPIREVRRESAREDWRGRVAGMEVCRRLEVYGRSSDEERAAIDAHNRACDRVPRPTRHKSR